ncbi:hypothetical protein AGMMS49982_07550 [Bacteroidia bacterium]|nr:hypothetical protein AGMMS49982_07550 [Bacteroidia bacterium]
MRTTIILQISEISTTGNLIRDILGSPAGSFASVLGFLILAGWLVYFVTKQATQYACESKSDRDSVKGLQSNVDIIRQDISYIKGNIDLLFSYMRESINLLIRDRYFQAKGINVSDIDEHDPHKKN